MEKKYKYMAVVLVDASFDEEKEEVTISKSNIPFLQANSKIKYSDFDKWFLPVSSGDKITNEDINHIINISKIKSNRIDGKTVLTSMQILPEYISYSTSSCVNPANFDMKLGRTNGIKKITSSLWDILGFCLAWGRKGLNQKRKDKQDD